MRDIDTILGYCVQAQHAKGHSESGLYKQVINEAAKTPIGNNNEAREELKKSNDEVG